jgi:hypothetical protein
MALKSDEPIHVLLVGPPASAKTIFLEALRHKLGDKQAYFAIGSSSTKGRGSKHVIHEGAKVSK